MAPRPPGEQRRGSARAALAVAVAVLVLLASCSSDDGGSDASDASDLDLESPPSVVTTTAVAVEPGTAEAYAAALTASLRADPSELPLMDDDQAVCVAPAWVEVITPERFGSSGLRPEDLEGESWARSIAQLALTVDEAAPLVDALATCGVDVRRTMIDSARSSDGSPLDAESTTCLEKDLTPELAARFAAVGLSGATTDPVAGDVSAQYLAVLQKCGLYTTG